MGHHFPTSFDGPTAPTPAEALAALATARAPYEAALAAMTYTQDSIDNVRTLRYAVELAAFKYALSVGARDIHPPLAPTIPGTYPGIAPALTAPTDISGCVLWLDANLGVTADMSGNVSAVADQSGNGNDAISDLGQYQKIANVFGTGATSNGLFNDTSSGTLKSTTLTRLLPPGAARTVFVVAKAHFINDGAIFIDFQPGRTTAAKSLAFGIYNKASGGTAYPASDLSSIDESSAASLSTFADVAQIYAYTWVGSGHSVKFAVGGATPVALAGTALTSETGDNAYLVGHGYGAAHHGPMRGSIGAVIVYDSILSTVDYGRVCVWLKNRFSLAAP